MLVNDTNELIRRYIIFDFLENIIKTNTNFEPKSDTTSIAIEMRNTFYERIIIDIRKIVECLFSNKSELLKNHFFECKLEEIYSNSKITNDNIINIKTTIKRLNYLRNFCFPKLVKYKKDDSLKQLKRYRNKASAHIDYPKNEEDGLFFPIVQSLKSY